MIDLRIYRAALLPALLAFVVLMFSLEPRPDPVGPDLAPEAFDSEAAVQLADEIVRTAPQRRPGSEGSDLAAEIVSRELATIEGVEVLEQRFEARYDGRSEGMRNVIAFIPGRSDRRVAILAHRDEAGSTGASTSAAATALLVELARALGRSRNERTIVVVSTDGGEAGAAGAREFATRFEGAERTDAAIVLDQPGLERREGSVVQPWSAGPHSTSIQLVQSARTAVRREIGPVPFEGALTYYLRLAFPLSLGEQGPLIARDMDAVGLSGNGGLPAGAHRSDRPPDPDALGQFGAAALSLALALDGGPMLDHGPGAYVLFAGQMVPGWAIALFALVFLIPPALAALDGVARARRRREPVGAWLAWIGVLCLPFVVTLLLAYGLALVGLIPRPLFPYDPGRFPLDGGALAGLGTLLAVVVLGLVLVRPVRGPRRLGRPSGEAPAAVVAFVLTLGLAGLWLLNPFLTLLLVPAAHLWLLAALLPLRARPMLVAALALAGGVPTLVGLHFATERLDAGFSLPWQVVLMVTGGHVDVLAALLACLLAACLVAALSVAAARRHDRRAGDGGAPEVTVRGPATYAGPGSLGGTESALPRS